MIGHSAMLMNWEIRASGLWLQALEAVKLAAGVGKTLSRRLLLLDALDGRMHTVKLRAR